MVVLTVLVGVAILSLDLMGEHAVWGQARAARLNDMEMAVFALGTDLVEAYAPRPMEPDPEAPYKISPDKAVLYVRLPRLENDGTERRIRYSIEADPNPEVGNRLVRYVDTDGDGTFKGAPEPQPPAGADDLVGFRVIANHIDSIAVTVAGNAFQVAIQATPVAAGEPPLTRTILVRPRNRK